MRISHRELMPSIWGTVLVVVARLRAAVVSRLCCTWPFGLLPPEPLVVGTDIPSST